MGRIKKVTQTERIHSFMKTHKKGITALQALKYCGCFDLAGRIRDLKEKGVKIESEYIKVQNAVGEVVKIKQYRLAE